MSAATATAPVRERPILFSGPMVRAILDGRKTQTRRVIAGAPKEAGCCVWARPIGPEHKGWAGALFFEAGTPRSRGLASVRSPLGAPGDRLWVRETWGYRGTRSSFPGGGKQRPPDQVRVQYQADGAKVDIERPCDDRGGVPRQGECGCKTEEEHSLHLDRWWKSWRPSIHMPRWASRITLEVTDVRVERVQSIGEDDAIAEGVEELSYGGAGDIWLGMDPHDGGDTRDPVEAFRWLWDSINKERGFGWDANPWVWVVEFRKAGRG